MHNIPFRIRPRLRPSLVLSCCCHFNTSLNGKRNEHARHLAHLGSVPLWIFTSKRSYPRASGSVSASAFGSLFPLASPCFGCRQQEQQEFAAGRPGEGANEEKRKEEGGKDQQFLVIVRLQLPPSLPCHASVTLQATERASEWAS